MSTNNPRMDRPKTECSLCVKIWQEHTLNQVDACMAKLKQEMSESLARMATLRSGASVSPSKIDCPVCSKPFGEHTEPDLSSCAGKWPKRERGTSGFDFQHEFVEVHFKGEESDPVKRAELQAQTRQLVCSCGKTVGDHTEDGIMACLRGNAGGKSS